MFLFIRKVVRYCTSEGFWKMIYLQFFFFFRMRSEVDSFSWNWTQFQDQPGQLWLTSLDAGVSDLTHSAAEKGAVTWVASDGTFAPAADPGSQSYLQCTFSSCRALKYLRGWLHRGTPFLWSFGCAGLTAVFGCGMQNWSPFLFFFHKQIGMQPDLNPIVISSS